MMNDVTGVEINLENTRENLGEEGEIIQSKYLPYLLPYDTPKTTTNERMQAIERWMEVFTKDRSPYPMSG